MCRSTKNIALALVLVAASFSSAVSQEVKSNVRGNRNFNERSNYGNNRLRQRQGLQIDHVDLIDGPSHNEVGSNSQDQKSKKSGNVKVRAIIKYDSDKGKELALNRSTQVFHDFATENTVVVELDAEDYVILQKEQNDIISVEDDAVWLVQGYVEEHLDADQSRRLSEVTPYGVTMVQAPWIPYGSTAIKICLVDTGVALGHPDLDSSLLTGTSRYANDGELLTWNVDTDGHGSVVAGIVNAIIGNDIGVRGVGKIPAYITRGIDNSGQCHESDVLQAIDECLAAGTQIISLSLGGASLSNTFKAKLDYLYDTLGVLIFAAGGNSGIRQAVYPAAYNKVVAVGAVNETGQHWPSSNTGEWIEVVAPGDRVLSTSVNSAGQFTYAIYSGTSMATPYAAGVAALLWSHFPQCTNSQIRYALAYSAKVVDDGTGVGHGGCDPITGNGLVQAYSGYQFLSLHTCVEATWGSDKSASGCTLLQ